MAAALFALLLAPAGAAASPRAVLQRAAEPNPAALARANALLAQLSADQKIAVARNDFSTVASLGIPAFSWQDGPNGIRTTGTTSLPSAQALAATFDRTLARRVRRRGRGRGARQGLQRWLGPAMDIARTPLSGRQPENLGEDPFLAGHTAAEEVLGAKSRHVIAVLKHFVANNQEWARTGLQTGPVPFVRGPAMNVVVARADCSRRSTSGRSTSRSRRATRTA